MRRIGGILAVAGLLLAPVAGFTQADNDWQYWNTESVEGKLTDNLKAYVEAEFRFEDDASNFYYSHTHLELKYKVCDWFEIGPAYRQVWELLTSTKDEDNDWFAEYRPMLNGTVKWTWADWKFGNRARVSYRMFDVDKDDVWRFRNKLTIKSPWKWTALNINPYIADEIFLEENKDGIFRNRFYVGVGMKLFEHVNGDIFYLWQTTEKGDDWIDFNVVGTKLKVKF